MTENAPDPEWLWFGLRDEMPGRIRPHLRKAIHTPLTTPPHYLFRLLRIRPLLGTESLAQTNEALDRVRKPSADTRHDRYGLPTTELSGRLTRMPRQEPTE